MAALLLKINLIHSVTNNKFVISTKYHYVTKNRLIALIKIDLNSLLKIDLTHHNIIMYVTNNRFIYLVLSTKYHYVTKNRVILLLLKINLIHLVTNNSI